MSQFQPGVAQSWCLYANAPEADENRRSSAGFSDSTGLVRRRPCGRSSAAPDQRRNEAGSPSSHRVNRPVVSWLPGGSGPGSQLGGRAVARRSAGRPGPAIFWGQGLTAFARFLNLRRRGDAQIQLPVRHKLRGQAQDKNSAVRTLYSVSD